MLTDLRLAARTLLKSPAFFVTTVVVLALGIGANTAIFSLINQVLLRPDGIRDPERIVSIRARYDKLKLSSISVSAPDFKDVENGREVFECAAVVGMSDYNYTAGEVPQRLLGGEVSHRWFEVFGARAALGRTFRAEEDRPNANQVVVLAAPTWTRLFGGDPSVVGRSIELNGKWYKVIGVMESDFRWPRRVDLWVPIALPDVEFTEDYRFNEHLDAVARLRPGVSFEQGDAYVRMVADRLRNSAGENGQYARDSRWGMFAIPITDYLATDTKRPLVILMAAVAVVLLIACANVAGLLVARAASRSRDIAVRAALGATPRQLIRQALAESLVLASAGALLGLALAWAGTKALLLLAPRDATIGLAARLDMPVLLFTIVAAIVTAIFSAAAPAWQAVKVAPFAHIKAGTRSTTEGRAGHRVRALLVISETALALVLLVGAGLLLQTVARLQAVNPGFDPSGVVTARLSLPRARYEKPETQAAFMEALTERLRAGHGVSAAAVALPLPFSGMNSSASFQIQGRVQSPGDPGPHGGVRLVSPGYFRVLGIPLLEGRLFTEQDRTGSEKVAIVDENLARQYWSGANPLGQRIRIGNDWHTVVGVVGHVKHSDLATDTGKGVYYFPIAQRPVPFASMMVKSSGGTTGNVIAQMRQALKDVDASLPMHDELSMEESVSTSLAPRRFVMQLLGFFAAVALVMAALGLYGVISHSVSQRVPEIGVRLALGAPRSQVLGMVVGQGLRLALVGITLGLVIALFVTRMLASQLYETSAYDPVTLAVTASALFVAAMLASYIPARRATRVDPLLALRSE